MRSAIILTAVIAASSTAFAYPHQAHVEERDINEQDLSARDMQHLEERIFDNTRHYAKVKYDGVKNWFAKQKQEAHSRPGDSQAGTGAVAGSLTDPNMGASTDPALAGGAYRKRAVDELYTREDENDRLLVRDLESRSYEDDHLVARDYNSELYGRDLSHEDLSARDLQELESRGAIQLLRNLGHSLHEKWKTPHKVYKANHPIGGAAGALSSMPSTGVSDPSLGYGGATDPSMTGGGYRKRDLDSGSLHVREDVDDHLMARDYEPELYSRDYENDLVSRDYHDDIYARDYDDLVARDYDDIYARDYNDGLWARDDVYERSDSADLHSRFYDDLD
ncbi:hypothetical protein C8Q75DRAFT_347466 [Abortiporus biennis]|nr:hypothetical protein C8Q75DRAFT_347466 [Abortiporus biennis]